jgi:hypothetical protein
MNRLVTNRGQAITDAPKAESRALTPAAERMQRHRNRRNKKMRCLIIEIRETEIESLINNGLLSLETRNDMAAIRDALYSYLDQTLN